MGNHDRPKSRLSRDIEPLFSSPRMGAQVVYQITLPENPAIWLETDVKWPNKTENALQSMGIHALYRHQARTIKLIRNRRPR